MIIYQLVRYMGVFIMDILDLLILGVARRASDLHLSAQLPPILRIEGDLVFMTEFPALDSSFIKDLLFNIMKKDQQDEFEGALELDFVVTLQNIGRFRVNMFHQSSGVAAVFRIIPHRIPTLDELSLPPVFKKILNASNGLILITGPTGSGKSTTLAAMVDHINRVRPCHIITIEDPIEFVHSSKKSLINQRQVHQDTHHFTTALRSALREDPDILLLGEMRDLETIRLALTAAETGHLVLATLHASSAPRAITRIVDVFPLGEKEIIRNMLAESFQAVVCQTLLKKIGGGRVPAFEVMLGTTAIRHLIREDKTAQMYSVIQTNNELGMCTLDQYKQELVLKGITT